MSVTGQKVAAFTAFLAERFDAPVAPISGSSGEAAPEGSVALCVDLPRPAFRRRAFVQRLADITKPATAAVIAAAPGSWRLEELRQELEAATGRPTLAGFADRDARAAPVLCLDAHEGVSPAPPGFRVLCVIPAYNEQDVVVPVVTKLREQDVEVHVIDHWSTDQTVERLGVFAGDDGVTIERYPAGGPSPHNQWFELLTHVERINDESAVDWMIIQSADEVMRPPWKGVGLRDALWQVQRRGFSAVDHTVLDFRPVDDRIYDGEDPELHFRFFEFPGRSGSFLQIRTWKREPGVSVAESAGHEVTFNGRRVFPYKFLLKHYSLRSAEHGRRKILQERIPRLSPDDAARGWHYHYAGFAARDRYVWDREELIEFDEASFELDFLIERLSGVGIPREEEH